MKTEVTFSKTATHPKAVQNIRPLGWTASLLHFGLPAALLFMSFHYFRPWLELQGYSPLVSYLAAVCVPVALLLAAALMGYQRVEGRPMTRTEFAARMRFPQLKGKDFLWGLGIFVLGTIGVGLISAFSRMLIQAGIIPIPEGLPALVDPRLNITPETLDLAAGGDIYGQWGMLALALVTYFFNIVGEELWWRGYIFPRQELVFGRFTWLVHGLLWAGFHAFKWWDLLALIPICLLTAYSAQKLKNNWPALIGHALTNFMMLPLLLAAVAGWF